MKRTVSLLIICALFLCPTIFAAVYLPYGKDAGQVGFINAASTQEYIGTPLPLGPQAFRIVGSEFWVADSLQGRIYRIDSNGKVAATIQGFPKDEPVWIGDLAVERDSQGNPTGVWAINRHTQEAVLLSMQNKILRKIGGIPTFIDAIKIELSKSGDVYIGDKGRERVYIFNSEGKLTREIPSALGTFCLGKNENLYTMIWNENTNKWLLVTYNSTGEKVIEKKNLSIPADGRPQLWGSPAASEVLITFADENLPPGTLRLMSCSSTENMAKIQEIPVPEGMNRFLDIGEDGAIWRCEADFDSAPKGSFAIVPFIFASGIPQG